MCSLASVPLVKGGWLPCECSSPRSHALYTYIHACMHARIHTYIHTYSHACMHACIHTCMHACIHTCMHACMHACIHTYTHTLLYSRLSTRDSRERPRASMAGGLRWHLHNCRLLFARVRSHHALTLVKRHKLRCRVWDHPDACVRVCARSSALVLHAGVCACACAGARAPRRSARVVRPRVDAARTRQNSPRGKSCRLARACAECRRPVPCSTEPATPITRNGRARTHNLRGCRGSSL